MLFSAVIEFGQKEELLGAKSEIYNGYLTERRET
jgi:hypothetical protein